MRNNAHIQDIISSLSYDFPLESFEEVQEVIDLVNQVWNHIPQWQLKGWASRQVFEQHEKNSTRPGRTIEYNQGGEPVSLRCTRSRVKAKAAWIAVNNNYSMILAVFHHRYSSHALEQCLCRKNISSQLILAKY